MNKIQKYYKLQREVDELKAQEDRLVVKQERIFMSKFKATEYIDASGIFDVFLKNPDRAFDRWDAQRYSTSRWSRESLKHNINKIFKVFYEEGLIVRDGRGYYTINSKYIKTIKRNRKKD